MLERRGIAVSRRGVAPPASLNADDHSDFPGAETEGKPDKFFIDIDNSVEYETHQNLNVMKALFCEIFN